jgi:ESS family glutamate:Na+ symporter
MTPFPFESMLAFGFLSVMLLAGILTRATFPLVQRFLFPSCLIGGVFALALLSAGVVAVQTSLLETFAFHFFIISFISIGLTRSADSTKKKGAGQGLLRASFWMALMEGVTLPMQAIIGGLVVITSGLLGLELFSTFGFLVPLGFTEGPGQALSIGKVWEGFGFENAATLGLTFAAIGFFFAFFVGVPLVNYGIRKGFAVHGVKTLPADLLRGVIARGGAQKPAGALTLHSGNVDTLAFQAALIGLVYLITYGFVVLLARVLPPDAGKILWGFFFFFGMAFALLVRRIMAAVGIDHLIDPGIQRRITGWSVDFLIVATVAAIKVVVVWQYILPISAAALLSGVMTTLVVVWLGNRIENLNLERTMAIYGTCTGTVSSGLLLLRIVDPEFKTSVALEIGFMNMLVVPIVVGCMVLVNAPVWWGWSVTATCLAFAAILAVCLVLMRLLKYIGAPKFRWR